MAIKPPMASISLTRWLLPMPPIAGLQDILPIAFLDWVIRQVCFPYLAHAKAASAPACPPPITMISKLFITL